MKFNLQSLAKKGNDTDHQNYNKRLQQDHQEAPNVLTDKQLEKDSVPEKDVTTEKLLEKNRTGGMDKVIEKNLSESDSKLVQHRNSETYID